MSNLLAIPDQISTKPATQSIRAPMPFGTGPTSAPQSSAPPLVLLSDSSFTQLVNEAFRNYQSTLALSRSPLANSPLVTPTLLLDEASPTAEERGRGLRLLLRWAVEQIAPAPVHYRLGEFRPFDDPSWSDPRWWRYNILRHRYLEPLHPDDFVEGGRFTETLMALTGITSSDSFFDERNRAIQAVADRLRQQLIDNAANQTLQQLALAEIERLLDGQESAAHLLGIAATFAEIFERPILLEMATAEQLAAHERTLHYLISHRLLLSGDGGRSLWISPPLRAYLYQRQSPDALRRRHRLAARYYAEREAPLVTAKHWLYAGLADRGAAILFAAADGLIHELQIVELCQTLQLFTERDLAPPQWREMQILLSDLYQRNGQAEEALAACRRALKATTTPTDQARIYRRMGKLYVTRNQLHALGYYQQAAAHFTHQDPEFAHLLKDRGWLYILQRNWGAAEADLVLARAITATDQLELCADIVDALASLYVRQERYDTALAHAQQALTMREQLGALPRIASSFNNLGLIYRRLGEQWQAINAHEEALVTYRKLGNQEATAGALLNIGSAFYLLGHYNDAVNHYLQSLEICQKLEHGHVEATVRYNLAEAYAALGQRAEAVEHWQRGYDLSKQAGFADEVNAFEQLRTATTLLQVVPINQTIAEPGLAYPTSVPAPRVQTLSQEEKAILDLVKTHGQVTAKLVIDLLNVSRATATRRLTTLVEEGYLTLQGKGRGVYYELASIARTEALVGPTSTGKEVQMAQADRRNDYDILRAQQRDLQQHFAVTALAIKSPATANVLLQIVVHYAQLPDLAGYLALKRQLNGLLDTPIDLLPDTEIETQCDLFWLWSAHDQHKQ